LICIDNSLIFGYDFSRFFAFYPQFSGSFPMTDAADFFRSRLDQMIDLRHPLAILASRMP